MCGEWMTIEIVVVARARPKRNGWPDQIDFPGLRNRAAGWLNCHVLPGQRVDSAAGIMLLAAATAIVAPWSSRATPTDGQGGQRQRYLYVALPAPEGTDTDRAVRLLVFDVANAHRLVRRIPLWPAASGGEIETVRGLAAHAATRRLYISTTRRLAAIGLRTGKVTCEKRYDGHCTDRLAGARCGQTGYAPM